MGRGGSAISQPVHDDGLITRVNIKGATHDLCHLPTYQRQEEFVVKFNVQPREEDILVPGVSVCVSPLCGECSHYTSVSDKIIALNLF